MAERAGLHDHRREGGEPSEQARASAPASTRATGTGRSDGDPAERERTDDVDGEQARRPGADRPTGRTPPRSTAADPSRRHLRGRSAASRLRSRLRWWSSGRPHPGGGGHPAAQDGPDGCRSGRATLEVTAPTVDEVTMRPTDPHDRRPRPPQPCCSLPCGSGCERVRWRRPTRTRPADARRHPPETPAEPAPVPTRSSPSTWSAADRPTSSSSPSR
jgi:hypothetical protein